MCLILSFFSALKGVFVAARQIHDLRHLGFGNLDGKDAADPNPVIVDMEHDPSRFLPRLVEKMLEHQHDELHRSVIVVQQEHPIHRRLLRFRLGPRGGADFLCRAWG